MSHWVLYAAYRQICLGLCEPVWCDTFGRILWDNGALWTYTLDRAEGSLVTYDLIGKIAEGAKLTRRTVAAILDGICPMTFAMFQNNPEEFITKAIRLINEQKATMSMEHIFFIAETKGTMETLNLKPIEQAKIKCAKKLFAELSTEDVVYHDVDSYQSLLNIMESL